MAQSSSSSEKLHTACDECRSRKLKCSGEQPHCARCSKEKISCVYSPQKQMGRPRKRRREGELGNGPNTPSNGSSHNVNLTEFIMTPGASDLGLVTPPQNFDPSFNISASLQPSDTLYQSDLTADAHRISPISSPDLAVEPPIDPSLWDISAPPFQSEEASTHFSMAPCSCLSLMYLTITELQSVTTFHFPQVVVPLRKAMDVLSTLINCPQCPKEPFSAIQNVSSIASLFKAIAERFYKVLAVIDTEAIRLEQTGEKKPYRIGDNSPATQHLHTGTLDCPMGFDIEIEARDWKRLAKTALRTEIYGNGSNSRPLMVLLEEAIARQEKWHQDIESCAEERRHVFGVHGTVQAHVHCEALGANHIKRALNSLDWD